MREFKVKVRVRDNSERSIEEVWEKLEGSLWELNEIYDFGIVNVERGEVEETDAEGAEEEIVRILEKIGYKEEEDWEYENWGRMIEELSEKAKREMEKSIKEQIREVMEGEEYEMEEMVRIVMLDAPESHPLGLFDLERDYIGDVAERSKY
jgi:hypothetical protein